MHLIHKRLSNFSAAHRLIKGYQGKCASLHGHNYVASVLLGVEKLNEMDFVIDFNEIKDVCDAWLDATLDHATIICSEDDALIEFVKTHRQKFHIIPGGRNTSAEVIAEYLFSNFEPLLKAKHPELILVEVEVAETHSSRAIYRPKKFS